jgi:hypothetical protein
LGAGARSNLPTAEQFAIHLIPVDGVDTAGLAETQASLAEELLAQELDALITNSIAEGLARRILEYGLPIICASESGSRQPRFFAGCVVQCRSNGGALPGRMAIGSGQRTDRRYEHCWRSSVVCGNLVATDLSA